MKPTFLNHEKPLYTVMIQKKTLDEILETIDKAREAGADAVGIQFEKLLPEYRTKQNYRMIFERAGDLPTYVTNYRRSKSNEGKTDDELAEGLLELCECGATLIDVMGDIFCPTEGEFATDPIAIQKQKDLIAKIHAMGGEVLMSSHVLTYIPEERVMEIANGHYERGADICKIVTGADDNAQQVDNLRIIDALKQKLPIPFLFLCGGKCKIVRRIGPMLGCCMWLCVYEHDELSTKSQPEIHKLKAIVDNFN